MALVMDISFLAPAQIQALVIPVGKIKPSGFKQYYERLRSANEVRLVDLSPDSIDSHSFFKPKNYPSGRVLYNFSQKGSDVEESLFDLEIWRAKLLVLGVAHYSDLDNLEDALKKIRSEHMTMSSCQILVFGVPKDHKIDVGPHIVPVLSSNFTSLETAVCDVTSNLFNSLNALAISKQMGSFKSPSLKALDFPNQQQQTHVPDASKSSQYRRHVPRISSLSVSKSGSISMNVTERAKVRQKGRSLKFMGSLYLLTGLLSPALDTFAEAATTLKNSHDHLWFASTIESISICLTLQAFYDMPMTIPTILINTVEGETESFVKRYSKSTQHQKLNELFPSIMSTVLRYYDRCNPESEEAVPRNVYYQTILRYTILLATLRRGGGWNKASLSAIVRKTELKMNVTEQSPPVHEIEEWCQLVSQSSSNINSQSEWNEKQAILKVYATAGLARKWAFQVHQLIVMMANQGDSDFIKGMSQETLEGLFHQLSMFYSNPKMKISCVRAFMSLATRMGNLKFVALASGIMLATGPEILSKEEQLSLYQVIKDDGEIKHSFCNPNLLYDIEITASVSAPLKKQQTAEDKKSNNKKDTHGAIIYNPYEQAGESTNLIQNDPTPVKVYLQNPFAFEMHISEIYIIDDGKNKISRSYKDAVIPPRTTSFIIIDLVPPSAGPLKIAGCWMQIGSSPHQIFTPSRHKNQIQASVLSARPSLSLRKTSIKTGWAMILEGEKRDFTVEISNTSSTPSSKLQFGFSDSTIEPLQQAISKPDATRAEIYELNYFLHERKAVELISRQTKVGAHDVASFDFQLSGKRGVSSATILVDSDDDESTRIRIPLNVTVYPSIEMDGIEIIQSSKESALKGNIVLLLSLRNSWRDSLEVTVSADSVNNKTTRIESMRTQRIVVDLDWDYLPPQELLKPIPTRSSKQYLIDTKTSPEMLRAFWLREKLLERIKGTWSTIDSPELRTGEIEMRGIQLNKRLLNALTMSMVSLTMWVEKQESEDLTVDSLFLLVTRAENLSDNEHTGMLRIVSNKPNTSIVSGNLQRPVVIPANSSITVKTKVMPLCAGRVEWSSLIDLIGSSPCIQRSPLVVIVK